MASALGFRGTLLAAGPARHGPAAAVGPRQLRRQLGTVPPARQPALGCPDGAALRKAAIWRVHVVQPGSRAPGDPSGAASPPPPPPPSPQADDQQFESEHARYVRLRFAGLTMLGLTFGKWYFTGLINWLLVIAAIICFITPIL